MLLRRAFPAAAALLVVLACGREPTEPPAIRELVLVGLPSASHGWQVRPPPVLIAVGITYSVIVQGGTLRGRPGDAECDYRVAVREGRTNHFEGTFTAVEHDLQGRVACAWASDWEADALIPLELGPAWTIPHRHYFGRPQHD